MASDPTRDVLRRRNLRRVRADGAVSGAAKERIEPVVARPGVLSLAGRLSVGALGLALALMVSVVWGTALFYLAARLGVGAHAPLSLVDAAHVYVGLVGGVFVAAKVARVRFRYRVAGVPEVIPWQRWISWSLLTLYSAVWISGVLLLLPIRGRIYNDLINFHLLSSVWAVVPTTWHVWHYRRRAAPYLTRLLPRGRTLRYWAGIALALVPAMLFVLNARAVSQLPQVMGGASWSQAALQGAYLDRIAAGPDGLLVAAGDEVYISHDGSVWTQVDIPGVALPPSAGGSPAVHQHGAPTGKNLAQSLALTGDSIYVGADSGLYQVSIAQGTLREVAFDKTSVTALAVDPSDPRTIWAGTSDGLMRSNDGGATWSAVENGLSKPRSVLALLSAGGHLYASDSTGVFSLGPDGQTWARISSSPDVVDLSSSGGGAQIYSTSATQGVEIFESGRWSATDSLQSPHQHHEGNETHPEVLSVTVVGGRLYAVGTAFGVSASADGGATWTQLGGGLESVTPSQAVDYEGRLLAATSDGLYQFELETGAAPGAGWWLALLASTLVFGAVSVALVGFDRFQRQRKPTRIMNSKEIG